MDRCKACNIQIESFIIRYEIAGEVVNYEEELCTRCKYLAFDNYNYLQDHDYNMDWYEDGLVMPKPYTE